jgi:hypothetical protein
VGGRAFHDLHTTHLVFRLAHGPPAHPSNAPTSDKNNRAAKRSATRRRRLAVLTIPHGASTCHKQTARVGFAMSLYIVQEFLGVLLVLAGLVGTMLFFGIAFILFREGIRRAPRREKTTIITVAGLSAKDQWQQRAGVDPGSAEAGQIRLARLR